MTLERFALSPPGTFGGTLAEEQARTPAGWQALVSLLASADDQAAFLALAGSSVVGTAAVEVDHDGLWLVRGVYTVAAARGTGVGRRLVESALAWASWTAPSRTVRLWVVPGNVGAVRIYERLGFLATGRGWEWDPVTDAPRWIELLRPAGP